jgi:diacylglycerol kinase (ATP)
MQRALLLVNRHSRRGQQGLQHAIAHLQQQGWQLHEASTEKPEQISQTICEYRHQVDLLTTWLARWASPMRLNKLVL